MALQNTSTNLVRPASPGGLRRQWARREPVIFGLLSVVLLVSLWELAATFKIVDAYFVSQPSKIVVQAWRMFWVEKSIYRHLAISAQEVGLGFVLALVVGVIGGLLLGGFRRLRYMFEPFIMGFYSTPTVSLLPLFILWFGIGLIPKVLLIFFGAVFSILVNTQTGVESVDRRLIETARAFRATEYQIFTKILLPSAIPYILAGVRLAIGRALIMVVVAEMNLSNSGIGWVIMDAGSRFRADQLFVGVLVLTLGGVALAQFLRYIENRMFSVRSEL